MYLYTAIINTYTFLFSYHGLKPWLRGGGRPGLIHGFVTYGPHKMHCITQPIKPHFASL